MKISCICTGWTTTTTTPSAAVISHEMSLWIHTISSNVCYFCSVSPITVIPPYDEQTYDEDAKEKIDSTQKKTARR